MHDDRRRVEITFTPKEASVLRRLAIEHGAIPDKNGHVKIQGFLRDVIMRYLYRSQVTKEELGHE